MIAVIYKDGEYINRIVADEEFAAAYCADNGYTYELEPDPAPPEPEPEAPAYTADDLFTALLGLEDTSSGGGNILVTLAALGPERYNALSRVFHKMGLCGGKPSVSGKAADTSLCEGRHGA